MRAEHPPIVIVTSNRTREIHDALKRRCLYHWIDYPAFARELAILKKPGCRANAGARSRLLLCISLRKQDFFKSPGVAETLDWASCTGAGIGCKIELDPSLLIGDTLGVVLKYQDDIAKLDPAKIEALLADSHLQLKAAE